MKSHPAALALIVGALPFAPAAVVAGTVLQTSSTANDASSIYISEGHVRMESASDAAGVTLFDESANEMVFVDHGAREYQRIGEQEMQRIARQIRQMREQMEQQLQSVPEEQRGEMREQMEQMMPGTEPPSEIRVEQGGSATTAGVECREATVFLDDAATHSVCVASASDLGMSDDEFRTITRMFDFFEEMTGGMSEGQGELGPGTTGRVMDDMDGVPIRAEGLDGGPSWRVVSVRDVDIAAEQFEIPAGYREVDPFARRSQ